MVVAARLHLKLLRLGMMRRLLQIRLDLLLPGLIWKRRRLVLLLLPLELLC